MENLFIIVLICLIAVALLYTGDQTPALGIIPAQIPGEIDYVVLSRWLAMMAMPLLINGYFLSQCREVELLTLLHLKETIKWLKVKLFGCFMHTILYTAILVMPLFIFYEHTTAINAFVLLCMNNYLWMFIQIALDDVFPKASITGLVVVAIIFFTFVVGEQVKDYAFCFPTSWGMVCRSKIRSDGNVEIGWFLIANLLSILLCMSLFHGAMRKRRRQK